jgi:uncharacterized membrane protein
MTRKENFWAGLGVGAGIGVAVVLFPQLVGRAGSSRIVRLEKSIQIGSPVSEVFAAWVDWDRLPRVSENITSIRMNGERSHWRVNVGGKTIEWDAITEQFIPNQAIGWKSVSGPKHTGRVSFSPIADNTIVYVTMNYAPRARFLRPFVSSMTGHMEGLIEKVLRDFKASVESRTYGVEHGIRTGVTQPGPGPLRSDMPRTGTFGSDSAKIEPRFSGTAIPVDYTNPQDAKR